MDKDIIVNAVVEVLKARDLTTEATAIMTKGLEKVVGRAQQHVEGSIQSKVQEAVDDLCLTLRGKLNAMTQTWYDGRAQDLAWQPDGCRFTYRSGAYQYIVVENKPQVRTLNFHVCTSNGKECGPYTVALPYTYFIFRFVNGLFGGLNNELLPGGLHIGMKTSPLRGLDDPLDLAILPNNDYGRVCLGCNFATLTAVGTARCHHLPSMNAQIEYVLSEFWQSTFTGALCDHFDKARSKNPKIATMYEWQMQTKMDPLFVLQLCLGENKSVAAFMKADDKNRTNDADSLINQLKSEIGKTVDLIGGAVQESLTGFDFKKQNKQKVHIEAIEGVLKEIVAAAYTELWAYCMKKLMEERQNMYQETEVAVAREVKRMIEYYKPPPSFSKGWYRNNEGGEDDSFS